MELKHDQVFFTEKSTFFPSNQSDRVYSTFRTARYVSASISRNFCLTMHIVEKYSNVKHDHDFYRKATFFHEINVYSKELTKS